MPEDVQSVLRESGLQDAYDERPRYQRNDYLVWIGQAKTQETRLKRLDQMLAELRQGGVYMGMDHPPSRHWHSGRETSRSSSSP
ncbi:MAG: YdeI/OmpD-associated family protein [Tetrasphaera sp.]